VPAAELAPAVDEPVPAEDVLPRVVIGGAADEPQALMTFPTSPSKSGRVRCRVCIFNSSKRELLGRVRVVATR
jgi:hypothetical protein